MNFMRPFLHSPGLKPLRGFTLIEIMLTLFVLVVILGLCIPVAGPIFEEMSLREPARQLQTLAKTARYRAVNERRGYQIVLNPHEIVLEPSGTKKSAPPAAASNDPEADEDPDPAPESIVFPAEASVAFRFKESEKWTSPKDEIWKFAPTGLCRPIQFRVTRGTSTVEFSVEPLTADFTETGLNVQ
jgi:prepilin-type N-terminal cleavage/methylation domain-containing protein